MTDEPKPEIVAAADWWASRLGGGPTASGDFEVDLLLAGERSRHPKRTAEQVAAFRTALLDSLEKYTAPLWGTARCVVRVDYDPGPPLADAAESAGIDLERGELPIKTYMWIMPGVLTVSEGYAAPRVLAWAAPGWERPPCGKNRIVGDHRRYTVFNEVCSRPIYHEDDCGDWVPDAKRCSTCGGTYVDHESMEAYANPDSCHDWYREAT